MQVAWKKKQPNELDLGIVFGAIVLMALCAARFLPITPLLPSCVFKGLTGIPCPSCGSTRAIVALAHFEIISAFSLNPLIAASVIISLFWLTNSIARLVWDIPTLSITLTKKEGAVLRIGIVCLVLLQWFYLYLSL